MSVSRSGWILAIVSAALLGLIGPDTRQLIRDLGGESFPDALVAVAGLVSLGLGAWSLLTVLIITVGGSTRLVAAVTPAFMRRALLAGAAGALVVGPAHAAQLTPPDTQQHSVAGLPLPDRPHVTETAAHPAATSQETAAPQTTVTVRPGDSLWIIAGRSLPDDATNAEIARATTRWHLANRDAIGADPNLIFPAQHLVPPTGKDLP